MAQCVMVLWAVEHVQRWCFQLVLTKRYSPLRVQWVLGTKVNSLVCEINGIILGLEMGIKCIHDCKDKKQIKSI